MQCGTFLLHAVCNAGECMSWKSILHDDRWLRVYLYARYNSQEENKRLEAVSLCVYSILNLFNSSIYYGACQNNDHMRRWVFFNHSEMSTWSSNGLYSEFQRDVLDVKKSIWMFNQQVLISLFTKWMTLCVFRRQEWNGTFFYGGRLNTTIRYSTILLKRRKCRKSWWLSGILF
jgi:hypothetical protein